MALLKILHHPDPRLRDKARPVAAFDGDLAKLIEDMFETMYAAPGVGLAATQIGVPLRVAVMDCSESRDRRIVIANPELRSCEDLQQMEEGCLSVPEVRDTVRRYNRVRLSAQDAAGKPFELDAEGLLAQCIQHEIDHLDGKLFVDYLSSLKRERIRRRLTKLQRESA
ncbi:MAG: peptide deformylase [Gammaproteobacteria bacterium]|nr:peptide deformylase [Gammaproteobacteria bacterium]